MASNADDDYRSSDDEDYVPEGVAEDEDEHDPSGDEVDEVTAADGEILNTRRRDVKGKAGKTKKSEADKPKEDKVDVDALFASMIADSESDPIFAKAKKKEETSTSNSNQSNAATTSSNEAPGCSQDSKEETGTKKITEVFDFAGDEVKVEREVSMEEFRQRELDEQKKEEKAKKPVQKRMGLGGALTLIAKKPKMSTLDKSSLDWSSFKEEKNISEELETFNKGKSGYLNRVDFLSQTDQREFEREKAMRAANRKPQ